MIHDYIRRLASEFQKPPLLDGQKAQLQESDQQAKFKEADKLMFLGNEISTSPSKNTDVEPVLAALNLFPQTSQATETQLAQESFGFNKPPLVFCFAEDMAASGGFMILIAGDRGACTPTPPVLLAP